MMTDDKGDNESMGIFCLDDDFIDTFTYNEEATVAIDMDKLDFRETTKDYAFFKKKFPLFDDDIINLFVELSIQEEKKDKVVKTVVDVMRDKATKKKPSVTITKKPVIVNFD
jgi:hypothetical protein